MDYYEEIDAFSWMIMCIWQCMACLDRNIMVDHLQPRSAKALDKHVWPFAKKNEMSLGILAPVWFWGWSIWYYSGEKHHYCYLTSLELGTSHHTDLIGRQSINFTCLHEYHSVSKSMVYVSGKNQTSLELCMKSIHFLHSCNENFVLKTKSWILWSVWCCSSCMIYSS